MSDREEMERMLEQLREEHLARQRELMLERQMQEQQQMAQMREVEAAMLRAEVERARYAVNIPEIFTQEEMKEIKKRLTLAQQKNRDHFEDKKDLFEL